MAAFEHVMAMLSFIYALAIGHLLTSVASLLRAGKRARHSGLYNMWMLNALCICIANWISFWDLRTLPEWSVATILFFLAMAIANYLQVALTVVDVPEHGQIDLGEFHRNEVKRYGTAFFASALFAVVANFVYGDGLHVAEWEAQNIVVVPMAILAGLAVTIARRSVQIAVTLGLLACWTEYFVSLQSALK